jgi:hypothetical protein
LGIKCDIGRFFGKVPNCAVPGFWDILARLGTCLGDISGYSQTALGKEVRDALGTSWDMFGRRQWVFPNSLGEQVWDALRTSWDMFERLDWIFPNNLWEQVGIRLGPPGTWLGDMKGYSIWIFPYNV